MQGEGLAPKREEGVILFEYDDSRMAIRIDHQEHNPIPVTMSAIFELPNISSPEFVAIAANELNGYKGIKVLEHEDSFAIQCDMFLTGPSAFTDVFQMMIHQIQSALGSFADACINAYSGVKSAEWCNINANTYIINDYSPFDKLKLVRASGIKVAPDKTYYGGVNKTISFKLYFPPIPKDTRSFSLIEPDSSWCFYGITLYK